MKVTSITATGTKSTKTVSDELFAQPVNNQILAQAVRVYLANQRQGSKAVQTRSQVTRSKSKWYRQKGTGNARHGSRNAPLFVGGGVAHGPANPKDWSLKLPTTLKRKALISALSLQAENVVVADSIAKLDGKTKSGAALINSIQAEPAKVLVIINETTPEVLRSLRNLENVLVTRADRLTALEVAMADTIIMTSDAVDALEARVIKK